MEKLFAKLTTMIVAVAMVLVILSACGTTGGSDTGSSSGGLESEVSASASTSEIIVQSVTSEPKEVPNMSNEPVAEFVEMFEEGPETMYGRLSYDKTRELMSSPNTISRLEAEETELGPVILPSGHQVYRSKDDEHEYILCGGVPLVVENGKTMNPNAIRDDEGNRIYALSTQRLVDIFNQQWEDGQKILSGEAVGEYGDIILDGALVNYKFTEKNGEIYFDLLAIGRLVNNMTYFTIGAEYFDVAVNEWQVVRIPTTAILNGYKFYEIDFIEGTFLFSSWSGDSFKSREKLFDSLSTEVSVSQVAKMIGWRMYFNGDVLSIVTDPHNQRSHAVLFPHGYPGIYTTLETDEAGNRWAVSYDDFGIELSRDPFVESDGKDF